MRKMEEILINPMPNGNWVARSIIHRHVGDGKYKTIEIHIEDITRKRVFNRMTRLLSGQRW